MIYIVTPFLNDFMEICRREGFNCPVVRGRPQNQNIMQIHHPMQLYGKKIFKIDKVFYGDRIDSFDVETLERIKMEIELRRNHNE